MAIRYFNTQLGSCGSCGSQNCGCLDPLGCPPGVCPDFTIRRNDTMPSMRVCVDDCGTPLSLEGRVLEASMWAKARLKTSITNSATTFSLADNIGFDQILVGDEIVVERARDPERMVVTAINEDVKTIEVTRGAMGTTPGIYKRGTVIRIFRFRDQPAICEMSYMDIPQIDGTILKHQTVSSNFVYEWKYRDTSLPGCYWLEFKLLKMTEMTYYTPGGHWTGDTSENAQKYFLTGNGVSDSSVTLSFDTATGLFSIPKNHAWTGAVHLWSDGSYYTGTSHDEGSVILTTNGVPSDNSVGYNSSGMVSALATPSAAGLGLGVEWVQRFPTEGEGFLIRISGSPTAEL